MKTDHNMEYLKEIYLHRKAFAFLVKKLVKDPEDLAEMQRRAKEHDMDQMVMYTVMYQAEADKVHSAVSTHHLKNAGTKTRYDLMEAVIDIECMGLTAEDETLNAYDTVFAHGKEYPWHVYDMLEIMKELGICASGKVRPDDEFQKYMEKYLPVDRKKVLNEIGSYFISRTGEDVLGTVMASGEFLSYRF